MEINIQTHEQMGSIMFQINVISHLVSIEVDSGFGSTRLIAMNNYIENLTDKIATLQKALDVVYKERSEL